jgi:hypothetical protein
MLLSVFLSKANVFPLLDELPKKISARFITERVHDSSVGIATGYGLDSRVGSPAGANSSPVHSVQTGSKAHPASKPMGTGVLSPRG